MPPGPPRRRRPPRPSPGQVEDVGALPVGSVDRERRDPVGVAVDPHPQRVGHGGAGGASGGHQQGHVRRLGHVEVELAADLPAGARSAVGRAVGWEWAPDECASPAVDRRTRHQIWFTIGRSPPTGTVAGPAVARPGEPAAAADRRRPFDSDGPRRTRCSGAPAPTRRRHGPTRRSVPWTSRSPRRGRRGDRRRGGGSTGSSGSGCGGRFRVRRGPHPGGSDGNGRTPAGTGGSVDADRVTSGPPRAEDDTASRPAPTRG